MSSEEDDIYPDLRAVEGSSEEQESNYESDDDSEYVPADDESLDESATEPLIEDAEEMAAMLDLVQENAIARRNDIVWQLREQMSVIKFLLIFCAIGIAILVFSLAFSGITTEFEQNQSAAICWERFKEEKCDINESTSIKCKKLLECSSAETKSVWNVGY